MAIHLSPKPAKAEMQMVHVGPGHAEKTDDHNAFKEHADGGALEQLPDSAWHTLDLLTDALGVTRAVLQGRNSASAKLDDAAASLAEASTLLQSFIGIKSPQLRQHCLDFVQNTAKSEW
ncbi:hypothetical protein [Methylobacterium dankookense]|uniref:hypothetical protein n=1 Tax=Methylobacterium dankookense TaxID=560405 RepID=UPI0011A1F77F|nr:hypothetical protein [Methylobacterium dankookense]